MTKEQALEAINVMVEDYEERYEKSYPYYGDNSCGLVVYDGVSFVGLVEVEWNRIHVLWQERRYDILAEAQEFFGTHSTAWGVYRTQTQLSHPL